MLPFRLRAVGWLMFSNVSTVDKRQTSQCWWMHNQLLSQTVRAMCLAYERAAVIHHRASPLADYILLCVRRHVSSFQKLECALATDEGNNTHTHTHTGCLRVHSSFHARSLSFVVVVARGALFTPSFAGNRYAKCERTRYINTVRYPFRRQLLFDNVNSSTMPMDPHVVYAVVAVGLSVRIDVLHRMVIFIFTNSLSSFGDVTAHITITHTYTEWHRIYRRQML